MVASLREQLQDTTRRERSSNQLKKLSEENQVLMAQNAGLKESNLRLSEEAHKLQQHNEQLEQVWGMVWGDGEKCINTMVDQNSTTSFRVCLSYVNLIFSLGLEVLKL